MTFRNIHFILLLLIILSLSSLPVIAAENYCTDPESWEEWEELVAKYPNDSDLQTLHALRLGLCLKVERGDLTLEEGTDIFEKARQAILEKKKAEKRKSAKVSL